MAAPNRTTSFDYVPGPVPRDSKQLEQFLEIELNKIKSAYDHLAAGHIDKLHVAPTKPRDGDIRYADGTNWDPGSGQGLYYYKDTAWTLIA